MDDIFYCVEIERENVSDLVESFEVEKSDRQASMATLVFGDSDLVLSDILHEGLDVAIDLGRRSAHTTIFRGIVTGIRANFLARGEPQIEVQAMDNLIALGFEPKTKRWWNTPISQIVRDIALQNKLRPGEIEPEADTLMDQDHPHHQLEETDLAFLLRLAKAHDSKLYIKHHPEIDSLNFVSTRKLFEEEPIEEPLIFNANLEEFSPALDSSATGRPAVLVTTDPLTGETIAPDGGIEPLDPSEALWMPDTDRLARLGEGAVRLAGLIAKTAPKRLQVADFGMRPPREVGAPSRPKSDRSLTLGDRSRRLGQTAQGQAAGSVMLRPHRRVKVEGCGGRWSGHWYLAEVRHRVDLAQRTFTSSFTCTR